MIYAIKYRETYEKTYFVKAETFNLARKKLKDNIREGNIDGPECCCKTEFIDDSKEYDAKELNDREMIDID